MKKSLNGRIDSVNESMKKKGHSYFLFTGLELFFSGQVYRISVRDLSHWRILCLCRPSADSD